jgi:hypothetical protein
MVPDNFRIIQGNYGVYWRFDSGNMYLMGTNSGDQRGSYSNYRPFSFNPSNGAVSVAGGGATFTVAGGTQIISSGTSLSQMLLNANGYQPAIRSNSANASVEFINGANNAANLTVYDGGDVRARGYVYSGNTARLAQDGNVFGSMWGNDWLSNWLSNQLGAKQNTFNYVWGRDGGNGRYSFSWDGRAHIWVDGGHYGGIWTDQQISLFNSKLVVDNVQQFGFIGGDNGRPYMMQWGAGNAIELLAQRFGGAKVNSPIRSNGYIEWVTDIGSVGTNYFTSDISYKENIVPNTKSYAQQVAALKFKSFDFKQNELQTNAGRHWDLGVIAQQIEEEVSDEYVDYLSDGTLSLNTNKLLVLALKTIQELQARVDTLEAKAAP